MSVAEWTFQHSAKAGKHTDTLPSANYTFYPLKGNQMNLGVIAIQQETYLPREKSNSGRRLFLRFQESLKGNIFGIWLNRLFY